MSFVNDFLEYLSSNFGLGVNTFLLIIIVVLLIIQLIRG